MALDPHPLNDGFTWVPARGPLRRVTAGQAAQYNEAGYFLYEDAFDADALRAVTALIDPMEAEIEALLQARADKKLFIARAGEITFTVHLVTRSAALRAFCTGEVFRDLAHDLIGPDVRLYWDQAVYKKPGMREDFPWHQDNGYTYVEPQQYLTCWVALTDVNEANGCPWVVPGLHRCGTLRHRMTEYGWCCLERPPAAVPVAARAGSIVVFSSLTPHRTGANLTAEVRKAYIVQFAPFNACTVQLDAAGARVRTPCDAPERQFPVLVDGHPPA